MLTTKVVFSGGAPENVDEKDIRDRFTYSVTAPAARHTFSPDILGRMRKELMRVMGVEEEVTDEAESSTVKSH